MALDYIAPDFDGVDLRIGLVQSRFNEWAGRALAEACVNELVTLGVDEDDITHITVPGALEIPVALARLAATDDFDALIAIGAVIRGETFHFEIVARESASGIARVSAEYGVPIANAVLTTDTEEQTRARVGEKGRDAARVAVEMANLMLALDEDGEGSDASQ